MLSIEDCIAMNETGDWFAFHRDGTLSRPMVMAAIARSMDDDGYTWHEALMRYRCRIGWVVESEEYPERGWWSQCDYDTPGAVPAWIVSSR